MNYTNQKQPNIYVNMTTQPQLTDRQAQWARFVSLIKKNVYKYKKLKDRIKNEKDKDAQIFISSHANSLPDCKYPRTKQFENSW